MGSGRKRRARRIRITRPKTAAELRHTEKAVKIVEAALREMGSPFGRSEADVACEIRARIRQQGASLSFMPIVASGRNASHVHHKPGRKIVRASETVIFDIGAKYRGCCSDITRMHVPDNNQKAKAIYRHALEMQDAVIRAVRPGATMRELQEIYSGMMKRRGYRTRHLIGHGIGSDVHERIKGGLEAGMVLTVEPGIYMEKFGGCRVEDMVLVRKGEGPKIMSRNIPPFV